MATGSFIKKEIAEHGVAIGALIIGVLLALFVALARQQNQEFSISPLDILSYALFTFIPLAAFILGNRLIVRDYQSKAYLFTESLPVGRFAPLFVKYCSGALVVVGLMLITLYMAASYASVIDSITPSYFALLALKTGSLALLYWAVVFAISLSGHLRLVLYVILFGAVYYLLASSSVDVSDFGPFALLLDGTLVYERVEIPQQALIETWALIAAFTVIGFFIALWHEGSMAEVMARPMARRDYLLASFLIAAFLTLLSLLEETPKPDPFPIATQHRLDDNLHNVTVAYLDPALKDAAEPVLEGLVDDISSLQFRIGPLVLPPSYIVHDGDIATWEFIAERADGPLVYGNLKDANHYDRVVFRTTVLHQLLLDVSQGRAVFEHYHWFLDGYTRLITEANTAASTAEQRNANHDELMARALVSLDVLDNEVDLIYQWQTIADKIGYASAEALAYSALNYLKTVSSETVIDELATRWLAYPFEADSRAAVKRWLSNVPVEFKEITGIEWKEFSQGWQAALREAGTRREVAAFIQAMPYRRAAVNIVNDPLLGPLLIGSLAADNSSLPAIDEETALEHVRQDIYEDDEAPSLQNAQPESELSECVLNYTPASAFDTEMDFVFNDYTISDCQGDAKTLWEYGPVGPGDRLYMTVEVRTPAFHQPIRLHAERVTAP